jgi:DNA-binding MarR family transcriptional regulator
MVDCQKYKIERLEPLLDSIRKKIHVFSTKKKACKDVTFAQIKVVGFLDHCRKAHMKDIAQALRITLPTATGLVDNLVKNGYLKRYQEVGDRRIVHVSLSSKGYKLLDTFSEMRREWLIKIRDSMTLDKWGKFVRALQTIDSLLESGKIL